MSTAIQRPSLRINLIRLKHNQTWKLNQGTTENSQSGALTPDLQPSTPPLFLTKETVPAAGRKIKNYILLDQLQGSLLYRAVNIETKEECAYKVVNTDHHELLRAHFLLDSHEHINPIKEVITASREVYIFFPKSYGDLHSYIRSKKRLEESEARNLFSQISSVVSYCHENGVILRDLKLRKFVFANPEKTQLKLETLGDAILLDNNTNDRLRDKHGCPAYVSPELLISTAQYSGRSADCWSLGVILYTILVGRYPFHDSDPGNLFNKIRRGFFTLPNSVSPLAKCLLRNLLRVNPHDRLSATDVLAHPWFTKTITDVNKANSGSEGKGHHGKRLLCTDQLVPNVILKDDV